MDEMRNAAVDCVKLANEKMLEAVLTPGLCNNSWGPMVDAYKAFQESVEHLIALNNAISTYNAQIKLLRESKKK